MIIRFLMLAVPVTIASAYAMPEVSQARAIFSALLAVAVLGAAIFISSSAVARLGRLLRPLLILVLAAPAICMALQLVPIPIHGLGSPIWQAASAALNEPLAERITVDIRTTVQAMVHYNMVVALALLTAVVALDRQCASQLLYMLVLIATCFSGYAMLRQINGLDTALLPADNAVPAVLGLLLSSGIIVGAFAQSRRNKQPSVFALGWAATLSLALFAMLTCLSRILVTGETSIVVAALLGIVVVLAVFAIRSWFYGIWGTAGVLATSAVLFLASFAVLPTRQDTDLTIALSRHQLTATERMLQDTAPTGAGAGAYAVLLPIHRDIGTVAARERPTAAAAIVIEMGRTFLCGLLIITIFGAVTLFRRSLLRGYDYVYAAIGSGAAVSLAVLAVIEDGILDYGASLLAAALFGLAFGQGQPSTSSEGSYSRAPRSANGVDSSDSISPPTRSSALGNPSVRLGLGSVAIVLIAQSVWLLTQGPYLGGLAIGQPVVSGASIQALLSTPAKSLDLGAGNLAFSVPPIYETSASRSKDGIHLAGLNAFADALHYSPMRGDLWLMLAAISRGQRSPEYDLMALLKLSYYTAPNDLALLPLRLTVALSTSSAPSEPELRELIKRDMKIALVSQPALRPALVAAYQSASADGKAVANNLISELDPSYLQNMHAGNPVPRPGAELRPPTKTPAAGAADLK